MPGRLCRLACLLMILHLVLWPLPGRAAEDAAPAQGGYIYVPAYSDILIGDNARPFPLAITLCLRNTSLGEEVSLLAVDYHDSAGKLLKKYLTGPQDLPPLASRTFTVAESEKHGGPGAKFVVTWRSARPVPPPLAEAVMIGTANQQGISFTSRGQSYPIKP